MKKQIFTILIAAMAFLYCDQAIAQSDVLTLENVFDLEYVSDTQISPDGEQVVYQRNFMDIMDDQRQSNLWIVNTDGSRHRPLTSGNNNNFSARWSPSGDRLLFASTQSGSSELYIRWMDTAETAKITNLTQSPGTISWSPDGQYIAFTMFVSASEKPMVSLPGKPNGANWADPANVIDDLEYRRDGSSGFVKDGFTHVFVMPAEGGTPRQITEGDYNHGSPEWTADGEHLIISSNRKEDWQYKERDTELYKVSVNNGKMTQLTDRRGPDYGATISPNGEQVAYLGYDDTMESYQLSNAYVMDADGSGKRALTNNFDRSVSNLQWAEDGSGLYVQYDDEGNGKIGFISLKGSEGVQKILDDRGGTTIGRPYGSGSFTAANGQIAYTYATPYHPGDVAVADHNGNMKRLTQVNKDLFGHKTLGEVEEIWYESSYDGKEIQGWIIKPPHFNLDKKYPLILEIHGGPHTNYGDRFTAELQLMAAQGYVVLYTNPRGSTSYGKEFGNYIDKNYPSEDHDDLMSGVDAVIDKEYIDTDSLYITGGSGGGVLSAWAIGKTDRFNAAVVAKPVINWYSFVLTSDDSSYHKYWFPGLPWENRDHYMDRSPISLVGNVTTPTMLLTGEEDYRTPMSETEQYYTALQLQKVESVMVRIPGSGHGIASRPSNLMSKVAHILEWFEKY